jgi:hypothetical protein
MRRIAVILALLAISLFAGACSSGGDDDQGAGAAAPLAGPIQEQEPDEIVRAAENALRTAESVRLTGEVEEQGERIKLDMRIGRETGARGTIKRGKTSTELIRIGDQLWLRGRSFWAETVGADVANQIGDRWVLVPPSVTSGSGGSIDGLTDIDGVVDQVLRAGASDVKKGKETKIRGVPVITLDNVGGGSMWVATEGPAFPLRMGGGGQRIDFAEYNKPVKVAAPKNVITDLSTVIG